MIQILIFAAFFLLTACQTGPIASQKWTQHECGDIPDVPNATYCFDESGPTDDVLWFFHGLEDSREVWIKPTSVPSSYPELISHMPNMRIITVSWGPGWLITGYPNRSLKPTSATLQTFKEKIEPYLKEKYKLKGPYKGLGHSMGGNNLAMLWAAYPELWSSVTLINPMLIPDSQDPWNFFSICPACLLIKYNYDNKEQWNAGKPSALLSKANNLPPLSISGCSQDILFHLYGGTREFETQARRHSSVDYHDGLSGCSHWSFDVPWVIRSLK